MNDYTQFVVHLYQDEHVYTEQLMNVGPVGMSSPKQLASILEQVSYINPAPRRVEVYEVTNLLDVKFKVDFVEATIVDEERNYTIEELEQAVLDILDGEDEYDLHSMTGLEQERCEELRELFEKVWAWNYLHGRPSDQK